MTTDPTPLQERIGRAMYARINGFRGMWERLAPEFQQEYLDDAAAVLPIIAAEVRKAQADAWDEGQASGWDNAREESDQHGGVCDMWKPHVWLTPNPYREQED